MVTLEQLKEEMAQYKDTLVLFTWHMARLLDVVDGDDDYYWVVQYAGHGYTTWHSCVGGWAPLKGKIDDKDYDEIERCWKLNEEYWPKERIRHGNPYISS